jgi:hypothetical protein
MQTFFLTCAILGGGILLLQLVLGAIGIIDDGAEFHHDGHGHEQVEGGLNLLTVRAISAGVGFFGIGGMAGLTTPLGLLAAIPLGFVLGVAAMFATAILTRWMLTLEDDGSVSIDRAVGSMGVVYLAIPGERNGSGKVHLTLQNRTVEYNAVTSQTALPTGAPIIVVDVVGPDTVAVVSDPTTKELSNVV